MKQLAIITSLFFSVIYTRAQSLDALLKKSTTELSKGIKGVPVSSNEISNGLKEALSIGVTKGANLLSQPDGFFANAALKILLPPEAKKVESTLRTIGMGKQVDEAILSMNRAAEDACKSATPIFTNAIKQMTVTDAIEILKGADTAATKYLQVKTTTELTNAFRPVIETSLQKTNATSQWKTLVNAYNQISFKKINPDLAGYVTEKSLNGIYQQIAIEEKEIRKNPAARTTDLLKKVFSN